jgi:GntR family transcriptional regulator
MRRAKSSGTDALHAGITRYLQLYTLLSQELADGRFDPAHALPSEPELVRRHGVSRTTVRRALERLEREGRIVRRRGSGTYPVLERRSERLTLSLEHLCALKANGAQVRTLRSGTAPVPSRLRARHVALGEQTHTAQRLHSQGGLPVRLETIYWSPDQRAAKIKSVRHEMSVAVADVAAAKHLRVPVGTALLRLSSEYSGPAGRLSAVSESLVRTDRASLEVTVARHNGSAWQLNSD